MPCRFVPAALIVVLLAGCAWQPVAVTSERANPRPSPTLPRRSPVHAPVRYDAGRYDAEALAYLVLDAANDVRRRHRLPQFRPDASLDRAARAHSADLARTGLAAHDGSDGSTPALRARRAGAHYDALGENVFRGPLYTSRTRITGPDGARERYLWAPPEALAREAVEAWMDSPGHRANLLRAQFGRAGVGVAFDNERRWLLTMDYAD